MKRTLIATIIAAAFAAPVYASPASLIEDLLSALPALDEPVAGREIVIAAADDARAQAEAMRRWGEDFSHELRTNLTTMYGPRLSASARLVKGAPYSADVITETKQSLADGNEISKRTVGAVYRDGEGRTRQESGEGNKKSAVYISDPVDGKQIVLLPESKRAVVTPRASFAHVTIEREDKDAKDKVVKDKAVREKSIFRIDGTEIRIENGAVTVNGKEAKSENGRVTIDGKDIRIENGKVWVNGKELGTGGGRTVIRSIDEKDSGDGTRREEIRVQVVRSGSDKEIVIPIPPVAVVPPVPPVPPVPAIAPLPPMPGVQTLRFESTARLGKGVTTQLGAKDFDGVRAEGKSTVWTIPAGEIGNRNPIQVTSESWYSPDLKVTVYSRYHDPRTGESIYRLANIRRAEPAKALFVVPDDYDTKGRVRSREERRETR